MMRCAFFEMKRLPASVTPRCTSDSISSMSEPGSTTTPQPITQRQPLCRIPEGIVCRTYFSRPTTTVWPALLPPWKRTTTFTCGVMTSTTFPLPSSPHCAPTTTMLGMALPFRLGEMLFRTLQHGPHGQRTLAGPGEIERQELVGGRARAADHQHVAHGLGARVGQRVFQPAADDVARHRRPGVAQPAGQRQHRRLLAREVDDEEVRSRQ